MYDIDFLPVEYRKQHANRHTYAWRVVAMAALAAVLAFAALVQRHRYCQAEERHSVIAAEFAAAAAQSKELARLRSEWESARNDAELFTYLRHPWPRTQILSAVLAPLPEAIALKRVEIRPDTPRRQTVVVRLSRADQEAADQAEAKLAPAARDLHMLRDEVDSSQTAVVLSGTTRRVDLLHQYLAALGQSNLFAKVDLDSLETAKEGGDVSGKESGAMRFDATVVVRPGYGQSITRTDAGQNEKKL
jgi:hypothetical protein